jgi:hypothetical protein
MKTRALATVAVASFIVLASCMQDTASSPLAPTQASFAKASSPCPLWSVTVNDGKTYFANSKDAVFAVLDTMKTAYATSAAAATPVGFRVLTQLAQAANAGSSRVKGDAIQGSTFANDVLGCMTVTGYTAPIDFSGALGQTGVFAVRSDSRLAAAVSRSIDPTTGPLFGAEPGQADGWYARLAGAAYADAFLFYGSKLPDTSTFNNEATSGVTFDLSTLPAPLSFMKITGVDTVATLRAGVCDMLSANAQILHEHDGAAILPQASEPAFCALDATPSIGFSNSRYPMLAFAAKRVMSWFMPQPLMAGFGGGSALLSGLSHAGPVTFIVDANTGLTFSTQPGRSKLTASPQFNPPIAVQVLSTNGTPLGRVKVALTVAGNVGSFTPPADSVRFTNTLGIASFPNFYLDKAGGYTITATTPYGSKVSNLFNISGK